MRSSTAGLQVVQSNNLTEQVRHQLLAAVASGRYRPGDLLPSERDLAVAFSASRIVIREALSSLAAKGIVSVRHGRGTTVNSIHDWNTLDPEVLLLLHGDAVFMQLIEMRQILEPELAALAADHITPEELEELATLSHLSEMDTMEEHVEHDTQFHIHIAQATHNAVLAVMLSSVSDLLRESRRHSFQVPGHLILARDWHDQIFAAIEKHDSNAARSAMAEHMKQVRASLEGYLQMARGKSPD